jgi:thiamine monophosphate synthase
MAVGAAGVAVISSILKAPDIQQAAHDLVRAVGRG